MAAFEALQGADFAPRIDKATGQLGVAADRYHEARIFLASKGLPKSGALGGFEALNGQSSMTTSQFMEQVRYNTALEQELARSIAQIQSVQSARVHLAKPRQSAFVRDREPATASVVVTPQPGRAIAPEQVQAIVHLVSSSVPQLAPQHVTVVDHLGNLFTQGAMPGPLSATAAQLQHRMRIEETYRARVMQVLAPVLGEANVRSQVSVELDFTEEEFTVEDFNPDGRGPLTRSEVLAEERSSRLDARGIPGALSNEPPADPAFVAGAGQPGAAAPAAANPAAAQNPPPAGQGAGQAAAAPPGAAAPAPDRQGTSSSRATRNYELDRVRRHVRNPVGKVERISVAVVVNERIAQGENGPAAVPFEPAELERLGALVRGVVGFDSKRGDEVVLVPARFEAPPSPPALPWYENEPLMSAIRSGVLALIFVLVLLFVVRPVVRHFLSPPTGEAARAAALQGGEISPEQLELVDIKETDSLDDIKKKLRQHLSQRDQEANLDTLEAIKANLTPKKSSLAAEMLDTANSYDDKVALIRMLVREDSGRVANVLKGMIK
jgi:flagellar M-ring protein FliF